MEILFQWDESKATQNLRKHRVDFETATQVFFDHFAILRQDRVERGEVRWQAIGMANGQAVLVVAHTVTDNAIDEGTEIVRIISARKADPKERKDYEQNRLLQS